MIRSILIANRGEIACRIIRTCQRLGIRSVAVFSQADKRARHVLLADEALFIGPSPAAQSYLSIKNILSAARRVEVDAIHPGFGFLAENHEFAAACIAAGFIFIGPTAEAIRVMGDKRLARRLVGEAGIPLIPGSAGDDLGDQQLLQEARKIGLPLMVKAAAGGGGKGMRLVEEMDQLPGALTAARNEAVNAFGSGDLLLEKGLRSPRHVEIQILSDTHGHVIHLGERECSIQRRFQKVIEESPSPAVNETLRNEMGETAVTIARAVDYQNAGTVEFLLDESDRYYFLEMNTRLQVEHPLTEMVTGIDLVEWQIRIAEGEKLNLLQEDVAMDGHAVEARIYAENPAQEFLPVAGDVLLWQAPQAEGIRVESGLKAQDQISVHYDPMLAKIIAHGSDRKTAVRRLSRALEQTILLGPISNLPFLLDFLVQDTFQLGNYHTRTIQERFANWQPARGDNISALLVVSLAQYQRYAQSNRSGGFWRNNPNDVLRFRLQLHESEELIEVQLSPIARRQNQYRATLSTRPESSYDLELHDYNDQVLELTIDGCRRRFTMAVAGDRWWVHTPQGAVQVTTLPLLPRPMPSAGARGSLRAPMPGSILAVLVEVGQEVKEGQTLMKLEAMKMEHTIRTTTAGVVEAVFFTVGDTVEADAELLKIAHSKPI
ncbi:MAG: biotin carboxylase N-terminal domain-containing protein [Candidatus Promineifilaceae bacterium]|nr:biotin carboxylase N-terminal domain-containing protein [Candidatus Promineifilaceae bacterium]